MGLGAAEKKNVRRLSETFEPDAKAARPSASPILIDEESTGASETPADQQLISLVLNLFSNLFLFVYLSIYFI